MVRPPARSLEQRVKTDVFTPAQQKAMQQLLAQLVHDMRGRPLEEGDWRRVYCDVKGIPDSGWSNLPFGDVNHEGLGVEQKQIKKPGKPTGFCGRSIMHPAATRSFRIDSRGDAEEQKVAVLTQYGELIRAFRRQVAEKAPAGKAPDLRSGWLLYQSSLGQFMYFEEALVEPDPAAFVAEWVEGRQTRGARKPSRNLWIHEKDARGGKGRKRYSITTEAGAKIQPYVDIPALGTPGLYVFDVFDAEAEVDGERKAIVWALQDTIVDLHAALREAGYGSLDEFLVDVDPNELLELQQDAKPTVEPIMISPRVYAKFRALGGKTDEERLERVIRFLRGRP